ncbi:MULTISPECIES: TetR/AcrR family transcriptional regulator [unclassified Pseudoclavibacter]|uniref:TetR/AcrR family transcriptional regulator n=1 Tax=unclassified Pseudoclavibacter TaxID=2615177 RepID=UPI001300F394|nr:MULTISPECIES: TetR/AcrR family transcriptional regulator [unclassified Pseudoclavibacter]KAB1645552.1 TetR family transcriptional regulator [Pseudoclavibacter sp. CFCC 14310]KAB1645989.1 TetR family transcriptional regulator [Pseudoclavibacter sp. CFCC 14310]KAB1663706.1 TetR family transcriptional regulator [Pseudoclavibacter sp. CFCC 13611]KAB1664545.1 TetR family transcriptional regulator [Pseudoclavibacter sp. CFCC 13611]
MSTASLSRVEVADIALALFTARGYDEVSAADIAAAAHVSRSTFFRQFGTKDDVIFADHDDILEQVDAFFAARLRGEVVTVDARRDVIDAALLVLDRFLARLPSIRSRDRIVRATHKLRDREIVTITRYQKAFDRYLREQLPALRHIEALQFADVVATTHNAVLRQAIRDQLSPDQARRDLSVELDRLLTIFAPVVGEPSQAQPQSSAAEGNHDRPQLPTVSDAESVVVVFGVDAPMSTVGTVVQQALKRHRQNRI